MNPSRISRLIQLLGLLQADKGQHAAALASACAVSRRTFFRDLDALRQAGVPVLLDEEQGVYRIPGTYFLPPTNFTAEEALAVMVLCSELGSSRRLPFHEAAHSASLKLASSMPQRVRQRLLKAIDAVHINLQPGSRLEGKLPVYQQMLASIVTRRAVRIVYDSFSDGRKMRLRLSPYRLLFSRHSWYVIGRSSTHRETRTFNVSRIQSMALTDEPFDIPRAFSLDRYLGNAWHLIPESGPDQQVVVRFSPLVAHNVAEVIWHKTQKLVHRSDGTLDFQVRVSGVGEIAWWILGYGDQAEVIRPAKLRQLIVERARRMVKLYNGQTV